MQRLESRFVSLELRVTVHLAGMIAIAAAILARNYQILNAGTLVALATAEWPCACLPYVAITAFYAIMSAYALIRASVAVVECPGNRSASATFPPQARTRSAPTTCSTA